jgi:hypothetical protein
MTPNFPSAALSALGLALIAVPSAANAQTVITRDIYGQPVETVITQQPVQTVTTDTVRTVRPHGRTTVTTRRTVSQEVVPAQPLYDVVTPAAPAATTWNYNYDNQYDRPLYDTVVAPAPTVDETVVNAAVSPAIPGYYQYIYQPDRILVRDPVANVIVQVIPRY